MFLGGRLESCCMYVIVYPISATIVLLGINFNFVENL